jgi:O-antigen ligase
MASLLPLLAWAGTLAFCVALPLWEAPKNISLAVAVGALVAAHLVGGMRLRWDGVCWGILAYIASRMLSGAFSVAPHSALKAAGDLRMLAAYVIFFNLATSPGRARLAGSLLILSTAAALLWSLTRPRGPIDLLSLCSVGHGNNVGMFLALSLALPVSLLSVKIDRPLLRGLAMGGLLFFGTALVTDLCRGALLAAAVFLAALVLIEKVRLSRAVAGLIVACLAAGLVATVFLTPSYIQCKLSQPLRNSADSAWTRGQIWLGGWRVFVAHPLVGSGPGNYRRLAEGLTNLPPDQTYLENAHQLYLDTLAETGLVGMAGFLAFLLLAARRLRALAPRLTQGEGRALWLAASGAFLIMLVMGLVDTPLHDEHALLLVALLGLAAGAGAPSPRLHA